MLYTLRSLARKLFSRTFSRTPSRRQSAVRPNLEMLEDRWMPSATTITVDAAANLRAIDPNIYGVNSGTDNPAGLKAMNITVNRYGGTPSSTYNWQQNASNRGNDYFFQSLRDAGGATPAAMVDSIVANSLGNGAAPLITVPTMDWVAQASADGSPLTVAANGINAAYTPNSPAFQQGMLNHLIGKFGDAAHGGVRYYGLDNEPGLWHVSHADTVTGGHVTPNQVRDKIIDYGTMIRQTDASAQILGPVEWNYYDYAYIPGLLNDLHQHELDTGVRPMDYLAVNYYPQGDSAGNNEYDRGGDANVSTDTQLLRNRSTRSMWDAAYTDAGFGENVNLIPKLHQWVNANYPGTKIALTEYNWGAGHHMNGATTEADLLGIFGREGLDMANRWEAPAANSPVYNAFKMYRNYDGSFHTFGDTSVQTSAPSPDDVSAFGALRSSDGALTVMAVNKDLVDPADLNAQDTITVNLNNFAAAGTVQFYLLSAPDPTDLTTSTISQLPDGVVDGNGSFTVSVPRQSVLLAVVAPQANQLAPQQFAVAGPVQQPAAAAQLAAAPAAAPAAPAADPVIARQQVTPWAVLAAPSSGASTATPAPGTDSSTTAQVTSQPAVATSAGGQLAATSSALGGLVVSRVFETGGALADLFSDPGLALTL